MSRDSFIRPGLNRLLYRLAIGLAVCLFGLQTSLARDTWSGIERIVAIGDLHGDFEQYIAVLSATGLVDADHEWRGSNTHLVQLGDIPDRGPDSVKIMDHLAELGRQAKRAGGMVHPLIGNHEAMNIDGDLRYVHPGEYQVFVTPSSLAKQDDLYKASIEAALKRNRNMVVDAAFEANWRKTYPLGYSEHRLQWQPGGPLAKRVARQNTVIKINRTLFVHAGLDPHQTPVPLKTINRQIQRELSRAPLAETALAISENGPLWYRGLARHSADRELMPLKAMLDFYDADNIVIAHTPTPGVILPRLEGHVIAADVGIGSHYGANNAALLIENGGFFAIHRGTQVPLPDSNGMLGYLQTIVELDPAPSPALKLLKQQAAAQVRAEAMDKAARTTECNEAPADIL